MPNPNFNSIEAMSVNYKNNNKSELLLAEINKDIID